MKSILKIFIVLMVALLYGGSINVNAQVASDTYEIIKADENSSAVKFRNKKIEAVKDDTSLDVSSKLSKINYKNGSLKLKLDLKDKKNISLEANLVPSENEMFKDTTLIGINETIDSNYKLMSLRIEKSANPYTLMETNSHMKGETVISVGILDKQTNDIYYWQELISDKYFDKMYNNSKEKSKKANLNKKDIESKELNYISLNDDSNESEEVKSVRSFSKEQGDFKYEGASAIAPRSSTMIPSIPDSIFKQGEFEKWQHTNVNGTARYAYSWIAHRVAGTENRLTKIVKIDAPTRATWNEQYFGQQLRILNNKTILYSPYENKLVDYKADNAVNVKDMKNTIKSNNKNGIFNRRNQQYVSQGSSMSKVAEVILGYVPYGGTALSALVPYTTLAETKTVETIVYQQTAAAQNAAYGRVIASMQSKVGLLKRANDYSLMELYGNAVADVTHSYSYSVSL